MIVITDNDTRVTIVSILLIVYGLSTIVSTILFGINVYVMMPLIIPGIVTIIAGVFSLVGEK